MVHLQLEFTPVVLFAVFVAEWRSGGLARRSSGGPAHQVVKSVGLTLLFLDDLPSSTDRYFLDSTGVPLHLIGTNNGVKYFIVIK